MSWKRRRALLAAWFAVAVGAVGCGAAMNETEPEQALPRRAPRSTLERSGPPALRAVEVGRVPSVTYGPYLGQGADGGLVVWAALSGDRRSFSAVPISAKGRPLSPARAIADAPENLGLVAVRAAPPGYLIVHTNPAAEGEVVSVLCVDAKGAPLGAPAPVANLSGRALWVEALPVGNGALILFASRADPAKRVAEIGAVSLDASCRAGTRSPVVQNVLAWQAAPSKQGVLLAAVRGNEGALGNVDAIPVDASGKAGTPVSVSRDAGADLDLDAARVGDNVVLAWTDRRSLEPRLLGAVLDPTGKLLGPPRPLTPPEGEQALLRLVPPASASQQAYLAWENLSDRRLDQGRVVQLSALDASGKLVGPRARLQYASGDGGLPELAATANGLSALTLAPVCMRDERCDPAAVAPTFVELDRQLSPVAVEPLRLEALRGATAELGFGLGCSPLGCFAIAALARTPAPIFVAELEARSRVFVAPVQRVNPTETPRVDSHQALSIVPSCAAFAVENAGDQEFLATITDFDPTTPWKRLERPAPDGRFEPLRARVSLEKLGSGVRPAEAVRASPISLRAHSFGGVTLAAGDPARGDLLVAWAGVDQGTPQAFLTLVAKSGDRIAQRMLTRRKGDLGDIAATWVGDGWVVAWVDERSGDLEVFATKVDLRLNSVAPEQRITDAPGAASEPELAFDGRTLRLVWSDARAADVPGHADIFTVALGVRDAARVGAESRLAATRAHSYSPAIQPKTGGFAVTWAERGEAGGEPGAIAIAQVGADGTASPFTAIPAASGEPRSVAIACGGEECRLAAIVEADGAAWLGVTTWSPATRPAPVANVLSLLGTAGAGVPPLIHGDDVLFVDGGNTGARVRRARVAW